MVQGIIVSIWDAVLTLGGGGGNVSFFAAMGLFGWLLPLLYWLSGFGFQEEELSTHLQCSWRNCW